MKSKNSLKQEINKLNNNKFERVSNRILKHKTNN